MDLTDVSKAACGRSPTAVFDGHQSVLDSPEGDAVEVILDIEPEN